MTFLLVALSLNASTGDDNEEHADDAGQQHAFKFKRGDASLTLGGKIKTEGYFLKNAYMLNTNLPDENGYLKETIDINFDVAYGEKKYGHKAVEFFAELRHKGVWGYALSYADKDAGPLSPTAVRLVDATFGSHSHTSGKPLIWFKDAWLAFSLNAAFGLESKNIHTIKAGWFPFDLGRGIAFGGFYGLNKELLGLYNYNEDKAAPGILLHGDIIKDRLTYDLYYGKFEERGKGFGDTIAIVRKHIVGREKTPWRGVGKDDDAIAGRLKWVAFKDHEDAGTLEVEPYVFYNYASDQRVEIAPDCKTRFGSYGFGIEHDVKDFEWGGEVAFNYGKQEMFNIDRNQIKLERDATTGTIREVMSHIQYAGGKAPVTAAALAASKVTIVDQTNTAIPGAAGYTSKSDRFRPAYTNTFGGYMGVLDCSYNFRAVDLKLAVAYGYMSGDYDPQEKETSKTYGGFVGFHELYSGKRVRSLYLLDERSLLRPISRLPGVVNNKETLDLESVSSDIQHVGAALTWKPRDFYVNNFTLNPNILSFFTAHKSYKFVPATTPTGDGEYTNDYASGYLGTELNVFVNFDLIKNLKFFGKFACFLPGQHFKDIKGVPLDRDVARYLVDFGAPLSDADLAVLRDYRLGHDPAFMLNMGLEFKF